MWKQTRAHKSLTPDAASVNRNERRDVRIVGDRMVLTIAVSPEAEGERRLTAFMTQSRANTITAGYLPAWDIG